MDGIGSRVPGWRRAALSVVAAVAVAMTGMSAGVASASAAVPQLARSARSAPRAGLSLAQAPAGLRAAVAQALGAPAAGKRWPQQAELTGSDVAADQRFGWSVAISGNTAVVGAPVPYTADGRGAAYVFVRTGKTWSQQAKLIPSDVADGDRFGRSVAISGTTVVVGAYGKNDFTGAAYVFVRTGMRWSQQAELTAADAAEDDLFGNSVGISGTTAVVGAYSANDGAGAAYVFVRSGRAWSQRAELTASDAAPVTGFGYSVAISGTTAVVGAPLRNHLTGAAYVFARTGKTWSQRAELTASDAAPETEFGGSVGVSGKTALVGARGTDLTATAYVFVRTGRAWPQQAELTANLTGISSPVAISGKTAVVGATIAGLPGAAYVFVRTGRPGHDSQR